jgi:hypothetical protein
VGERFHADLHIPAATAADPARSDGTLQGGTLLYDPRGDGVLVTRLRVSTDTAMRVCVGLADQDSQRVMGAYFASNGGAAPDTCFEAPPGGRLYVFHGAAGNLDVAIEGELLTA